MQLAHDSQQLRSHICTQTHAMHTHAQDEDLEEPDMHAAVMEWELERARAAGDQAKADELAGELIFSPSLCLCVSLSLSLTLFLSPNHHNITAPATNKAQTSASLYKCTVTHLLQITLSQMQ